MYVYSFHSVDKLINGHMISMAESKTAKEHKFLPVQEKLDIMNIVEATQNVPSGGAERKREEKNKEHNISVSTLSTVTLNEDFSKVCK